MAVAHSLKDFDSFIVFNFTSTFYVLLNNVGVLKLNKLCSAGELSAWHCGYVHITSAVFALTQIVVVIAKMNTIAPHLEM